MRDARNNWCRRDLDGRHACRVSSTPPAAAPDIDVSSGCAPCLREFRRVRDHWRPELLSVAREYLNHWRRRISTHWCWDAPHYPLPTGDSLRHGRRVTFASRREETAKDVYRTRRSGCPAPRRSSGPDARVFPRLVTPEESRASRPAPSSARRSSRVFGTLRSRRSGASDETDGARVPACSGPHSPASSYLVQAARYRTHSVVFDLGNGSFGTLQRIRDPMASTRSSLPPASGPLHRPDGDARLPQVPPRRQPGSGWWSMGRLGARPDARRMRSEDDGRMPSSDFRRLSDGATVEVGPLRITARSVEHPVEASASGSRRTAPS